MSNRKWFIVFAITSLLLMTLGKWGMNLPVNAEFIGWFLLAPLVMGGLYLLLSQSNLSLPNKRGLAIVTLVLVVFLGFEYVGTGFYRLNNNPCGFRQKVLNGSGCVRSVHRMEDVVGFSTNNQFLVLQPLHLKNSPVFIDIDNSNITDTEPDYSREIPVSASQAESICGLFQKEGLSCKGFRSSIDGQYASGVFNDNAGTFAIIYDKNNATIPHKFEILEYSYARSATLSPNNRYLAVDLIGEILIYDLEKITQN
jgi:hypothetical protein